MKYCPYCGTDVQEKMVFCPKCGQKLADAFSGAERQAAAFSSSDNVKRGKHEAHSEETELSAFWQDERKSSNASNVKSVKKKRKKGLKLFWVFLLLIAVASVFILVTGCFEDNGGSGEEGLIKEVSETDEVVETVEEVVETDIGSQRIVPFSENPEAIQAASDSVVILYCYDSNGELYATGSAFALFEDNIFVTNYHVIEGDVAKVEAETESGISFEIDMVMKASVEGDLAIIRSSTTNSGLKPLVAGTSDLLKGEKVVAIGSPMGLKNTVSVGLFSGKLSDEDVELLQFSAAISQGSSGGALFNDRGEVIGVTSASLVDAQNLNFAIPIETVLELWNSGDLIEKKIGEFYCGGADDVLSVDYVIHHYAELMNKSFSVDALVSSSVYIEYGESINSPTHYYGLVYCADISNPEELTGLRLLDGNKVLENKMIAVKYESYDDNTVLANLKRGDRVHIKCSGITYSSAENYQLILNSILVW